MRFLGVDYGRRRIGLALSDHTAMLARPWQVVEAGANPAASARRVAALVATHLASLDEPGLAGIVVGLPRRLNGDDTDQTAAVRQFAAALAVSGAPPVHLQDERLTSVEAEARLALRERDWRERKKTIDAEAAAIVLQDFLDARPRAVAPAVTDQPQDTES